MNIQSKLSLILSIGFLMIFQSCDEPNSSRLWSHEEQMYIIAELNRTTGDVLKEVEGLSEQQWNFRPSESRWTIAEIIEHLEMQNQLHFRELAVTSKAPQHEKYRSITEGQDQYFTNYATDTTAGTAAWFLEPRGKFSSGENTLRAFLKAREELTKWVEATDIDLRKQFTYRVDVKFRSINELKIGQVRDLHQLLLTGIAHTERHLKQLRSVKTDQHYPVLD